ncbi:Retroviral aspartyl protease [Trichostrongylus colubriformis]|uniref:RNA-directed DNA polymerase n=1 Tax=Trichostrongylus colubriformis TaxID=6319 RepID=A0AAN8G5W7_TRICO
MFKELIEEQRNLASTMMKIMDRAPQRDQGAVKPEEQVTLPNVMAALSNRIEQFSFDPDADMSFSKWFSRCKDVFSEDAKQLTESSKVRLLCEKLDSITFYKYQRHVLPRDVSQIGFDETVEALKQLSDHKTSVFTTRYQCLKLEKSDPDDYLSYTGRVNEFCEKAKIHELDSDGIKCLLWIFGLKSQQEAEIRQRLIAILDREHKAGRSVSLHELHQECENFLSLRRDSEIVAGNPKIVEATAVEKRHEVKCWNCGGNHYARQCKSKPWYCKKCRKTGHKEKFCDILQQKKPGAQEDATKKMRNSNSEGKKRRKAPRRQVRTVQISSVAVEENCPRVYVDVLVNNYQVKFLLDTGSNITLLNEKTWKKMGSPALERTSIVVKNASGEHTKIHGKLKCKIKIKGVETDGYAYVTPYNSLIGPEWIRANEDMKYHLEMMTAEVKMASIALIEEELKKNYPEVLEDGLRRCNKEEVELQLNQHVRPVFCNSRPVPHAALEAVNAELDRLVQMDVTAPLSHSEDVVVAAVENDVSRSLKDSIRRLPLTHEHVRDSTAKDSLLQNIMSYVNSGRWPKASSKLSPFFNRKETLSIVDGCPTMAERIVIPEELYAKVLKELHVGHPGIIRINKLARSYVYWPNLNKDCEEIVRNCSRCQEYAKSPIKQVAGDYRDDKYLCKPNGKGTKEDFCKIWNPENYR